jgi:hypothetical protein
MITNLRSCTMRIIYTDALTVSETGLTIGRGDDGAGSGKIPMDARVLGISIFPLAADTSWYVKGTHVNSTWVLVTGPFEIDPLEMTESSLCHVKSVSGNVTLNLAVKGE